MLDFQKLVVYHKARNAHKDVLLFLNDNRSIFPKIRDQLSRAALSVMLNIAEGSGRFTHADKMHYYHQARGSAFESLSCLEACFDLDYIDQNQLNQFQVKYEEISKMLFGMIKTLKK